MTPPLFSLERICHIRAVFSVTLAANHVLLVRFSFVTSLKRSVLLSYRGIYCSWAYAVSVSEEDLAGLNETVHLLIHLVNILCCSALQAFYRPPTHAFENLDVGRQIAKEAGLDECKVHRQPTPLGLTPVDAHLVCPVSRDKVSLFTAVMNACYTVGDMDAILSLGEQLRARSLTPDHAGYHLMVTSHISKLVRRVVRFAIKSCTTPSSTW